MNIVNIIVNKLKLKLFRIYTKSNIKVTHAHALTPVAQDSGAVQDGAPAPGTAPCIKAATATRGFTSRVTALCIRGAQGIRRSLCATLLCSVLILLGILALREPGWFIVHQNTVDKPDTKVDPNADDYPTE